MPFRIVKNKITEMQTSAIVSFEQKFQSLNSGEVMLTEESDLPVKNVIHAVIPELLSSSALDEATLKSCYSKSFATAQKSGFESLAVPLMPGQLQNISNEITSEIAVSETRSFFARNPDCEMEIFLVTEKEDSIAIPPYLKERLGSYLKRLSEKNARYHKICKEIDVEEPPENDILDFFGSCSMDEEAAFSSKPKNYEEKSKQKKSIIRKTECREEEFIEVRSFNSSMSVCKEIMPKKPDPLEAYLKLKSEPFPDVLMEYIAARKLANKDVYKAANIDSKLFSKIICTKNYVPSKKTVLALTIGLKLTYDEAVDFMATAGYAFSKSDAFDLIVAYFLQNRVYDMYIIEESLFKFTGKTLGNVKE